jgi:urease accessory protein UreE
MSSRSHTQTAVERRLRRLAQRRGWSLLIAQKRNPKIEAHGGYMLRDDETFAIVFGNKSYEFSASLEEIEAFLEGAEGGGG